MKRNVFRAAAPVLFAALAALHAQAQTYDVTNLGLGGGSRMLDIVGINASGQVAGSAYNATGEYHAFFASPFTGVVDIHPAGDVYSQTIAINSSGQVIGNALTSNDVATWRPFIWSPSSGLRGLGSLGGRIALAYGINDSGTVVGVSHDGSGRLRAFGWNPVIGMYDMGGLDNAQANYAVAINGPGQSTGYSQDADGFSDGLLFNAGGGANSLGRWAGATRTQGMAITDAGLVLGTSSWTDASGSVVKMRPFLYEPGAGYHDIGTLGGTSSYASAINKQGRVIGDSLMAGDDPDAMHAFTWARGAGITNLTLGGPSRTAAINEAGQVVGGSVSASGAMRAFSWTAAGGIEDLGTLGGSTSFAYGVGKSGQVVGAAALPNDTTAHAFLFDNGTMKDLNDFAPNKPAGLELLAAMRPADNGAMVAVTNAGYALLTPTSAMPAAPTLAPITADDPVAVGTPVSVSVRFTDAAVDSHTASWSFGDGSAAVAGTVNESNGSGTASASHSYAAAGVYAVVVTVTDNGGLRSQVSRDVVVYDPSAGFVTGSGSITSPAGAYRPDPSAMGPATFSFVSKYQKGANVPTGSTSFYFQSVNLDFESDTYDWLVVAGARAQFKGTGILNGTSDYKFLLTAVDGKIVGPSTVDRFRIKITRYDDAAKQDVVVYDNQLNSGSEGTELEGTAIREGNIVVHAAKN